VSARRRRTVEPARIPPTRRSFARGPTGPRFDEILTRDALDFVAELHHRFDPGRRERLAKRGAFRARLRAGHRPSFPPETRSVRARDWTGPSPPPDLTDRRVEITGPVDRKMIINALNSGAQVFMADFEDSHSPTWTGTVAGQVHLSDAVRRQIRYRSPEGKEYHLDDRTATLMVRPRGWHLDERHVRCGRSPVSASLFDFGMYLFHNAAELRRRGTGPYLYLPKMEHYLEARLWNDVFRFSEERLGLPSGSIRPTVLIETLPAAFQMDEILFELRERSAGLNCGRWDYLFSFIKQFRDDPRRIFPDRARLGMTTPFLSAYSRLLIRTCHRRGVHAMGGMAAQIPIKGDPAANEEAIARVIADKEREVRAGHDGTWVAHPGLVPVARAVFDREMPGPHQIGRIPSGPPVLPRELLAIPSGPVTEEGVRRNARVALRYLHAWLGGTGCVPIDHLMEDAATVEIARSQLWQWVHRGARTEEGIRVDLPFVRRFVRSEADALRNEVGPPGAAPLRTAVRLLGEVVQKPDFVEFITQYAYPHLGDTPRGPEP
jgi:malate synthase